MTTTAKTILAGLIALLTGARTAPAQTATPDLSGLWVAKLRFEPAVPTPVTILRSGSSWYADVGGRRLNAQLNVRSIAFALPDDEGQFRGTLRDRGISGHWFGGRRANYASPLILTPDGADRWRGETRPLGVTSTYYLPLTRRADGTYATYLRNPERNQGQFIPVSTARVNGDVIDLIGHRARQPDAVIASGRYEGGTIRAVLNGNSYDFVRDNDSASAFFPRGKHAQRYQYSEPLDMHDGWPVAKPEDVGISRGDIEKFVQMLSDMTMDSINTPQVHSFLLARHGKLVVEEYFHGYDRYTPHDLRSASKSWTSVLIGAAIQSGVPIKPSTPVYQTMLGSVPADLDLRKRAMTLEHLMSMTAGYNCAADDAPGNEDAMQEQDKEPDWYRFTLNVPMLTAPGDTIVYCSIEANLAGGMLHRIAREQLPEMFYRLVAKPLHMKDYQLFLSPSGDAYGGGGHRFTPRDFMKLSQLMLNAGKWKGQQIMSREWTLKSGSPMRNLNSQQQWGWLWNSVELPYKGGKVRGIFAGGNGGQVFMAIPDLDLVVAFTGGNYAQAATFTSQREFIPRYVLPAIR
ncbi:MAG: serine hydrolase domain-containing protein [Gemmatimonadaceae bacterium]